MSRRKPKHKPIHIFDEVYTTNYYVSYGVPLRVFADAVFRILGTSISIDGSRDGHCIQFESPNNATIIWIWTKRKNISVLAHEAFHATHFTMRDKGMSLSDDSDEAYAYLLQMLLEML